MEKDLKFTTAADYMEVMLNEKMRSKIIIDELLETKDMLDEDGYPSDAALEIVRTWHWTDSKGWFDFIKTIWWSSDWGWKEGEAIDDVSGEKSYCYYISTGGWSGNESIIREMQKCPMGWHLNWLQSRRGGHYIFQLRELKDD